MSRAGFALTYAHFEGFIKESSLAYLSFVESQRIKLNELSRCFSSLGIRKLLYDLGTSKNDLANAITLELIENALESNAKLSFPSAIATESNVSYSVLERILRTLNIDTAPYETKKNYINEELLNKRNRIAHGEYKSISKEEFVGAADEVLTMLRMIKTDIENGASSKSFLRV